jgi:hypothetical protein
MFLTANIRTDEGESVGMIVAQPKDFASGSRGFHGQGKITIGEKRYQCQVQLVEIGSKTMLAEAKGTVEQA